jgi:glycosyltransferase involved in cell wall biosynthesis
MGNNLITILLPVHNDDKYLSHCLLSLRRQSYSNFICLVGFNGTVDSSKIILEKVVGDDSRFVVFDYGSAKGKSVTLNKMLAEVKTEYFCLIDGDDVWGPDKLKKQMEMYGNFDVLGTSTTYIDERNNPILSKVVYLSEHNESIKYEILTGNNQIINSSCLVNTEKVRSAGGWDSEVEGIEDFDLWVKLAINGCTFHNILERIVFHRLHNSSNFNSKKLKYTPEDILKRNFRKKC